MCLTIQVFYSTEIYLLAFFMKRFIFRLKKYNNVDFEIEITIEMRRNEATF